MVEDLLVVHQEEEDNINKTNSIDNFVSKQLNMKQYIVLFFLFFTVTIAQAQEISDAVRYANNNLTGTARFTALSGAFGALGGDFSALNVNAAGGAVFLRNQITFTLNNSSVQNNTNYFGSNSSTCDTSYDLNQIGAVFVFYNRNSNSDWKKFTMAINYENSDDFDNAIFSQGVNPNKSVADYFLSYANGLPLNLLENSIYSQLNYPQQQGFLGYQGYIINPLTTLPENDLYTSNVPSGGNYYQENFLESSGYNGKLVFNMATQYKDKFFFGLNLNSNFVNYYQFTSFSESNANSQSSGVRNLLFENDLYTYGYGFSFQLGAIARVTNELRFGLSYESPTWYELNDQLLQTLSSRGFNYGNPPDSNLSSTVVDSETIMVYQPYNLHTPGKFTTSLAYVFKKSGLISFDYTYKDYSNTKYTPSNYNNNASVNQAMGSALNTTAEFRVGAEYRIKQLSLRGGYRFEQSPYKNKNFMGDLNGFSTGLGYAFGATKIDFAYAFSHVDGQQKSFSQGFTDGAYLKTDNNNFSLTMLFDF